MFDWASAQANPPLGGPARYCAGLVGLLRWTEPALQGRAIEKTEGLLFFYHCVLEPHRSWGDVLVFSGYLNYNLAKAN